MVIDLLRFLSLHTCDGQQLMLDPEMNDSHAVRRAVRGAMEPLSKSRSRRCTALRQRST
jgi:hypothetical protein